MLRLTGTCGHAVNVCLNVHAVPSAPDDVAAIAEALTARSTEALLERFCPFCESKSAFKLPLDVSPAPEVRDEKRREIWPESLLDWPKFPEFSEILRIHPDSMGLVPPIELACRYWERSRTEPDMKRAERMLRLAADIFGKQHRFVEVQRIQDELAKRFG